MWDGLDNNSVADSFYKTSASEMDASTKYSSLALLYDEKDDIETYGHQKTDMITNCVFSGFQCSPS
jgi:hypothetical protein